MRVTGYLPKVTVDTHTHAHTKKWGFTLFFTGEGNQVEKWEMKSSSWQLYRTLPPPHPDTHLDRVGHDRLAVDPEEAATITGVALLLDQFLVAQVEELVELFGIFEPDNQVLGGEGLLAEGAVSVLDVDLIEQLGLVVGEVVAADACTRVDLLGQNL